MVTTVRFCVALTAAILMAGPTFLPSFATETPAPAAPTGDLWETTSQMTMEGMPMALPAQKSKVCTPKVWKAPPGGADERRKCRNSDFKLDGNKATWTTTCAGPPAMTGQGEITRESAEAYSGLIKFTSAEGQMTVKLSGRRLGECTPKE